MARFKPIPYSQQELKELLDYNAETGILSWRKSWRRRVAGAEAGYYGLNYKYVGLKGRDYFVHRVIWKWVTEEDPQAEIDHKNGNGFDNRWCNIRKATSSQNNCNKIIQVNNTSGVKGVSRFVNNNGYERWCAAIQVNGKRKQKVFPFTDEGLALASEWLDDMRKSIHDEFACGGFR
ncbi:HNH endonuclease [Shigella sonnei]|nr:HNH endonuclease [Shigella sonnei]